MSLCILASLLPGYIEAAPMGTEDGLLADSQVVNSATHLDKTMPEICADVIIIDRRITGNVMNNHINSESFRYARANGKENHWTTFSYRTHNGFDDYAGFILDDVAETVSLSFNGLWAPNVRDSLGLKLDFSHRNTGVGDPLCFYGALSGFPDRPTMSILSQGPDKVILGTRI